MPLTPEEELELIEIEIALREKSSPEGGGVGEVAEQSLRTAMPGPFQLGHDISQMNPTARRAAVTGAAGAAGQVLTPMGAGALAATAGAAADAMDNPQGTLNLVKKVGKALLAPPTQAVSATKELVGAVNPEDLKDFAKDRAVEFGATAAASGILRGAKNVKPTGPATSTLKNPKLATEAGQKRVMRDLNRARIRFLRGADPKQVNQLAVMNRTPGGQQKLVNEAFEVLENGKGSGLTNAQLVYMKEAAGKLQSRGGVDAVRAKSVVNRIERLMEKRSPGIMKKYADTRNAFLAAGEGDRTISLIDAVQSLRNPAAGIANALPRSRRAAGAAARGIAESLPPTAASMSSVIADLAERRKKRKK